MKSLALFLVVFYQRYISPYKPPSCRFRPTCSHYAAEAIERHGAMCGCMMAAHRVLRCHPWSKGGYDPVK